jgi:N-acetylglucosamine-6-phosphate deacetylase
VTAGGEGILSGMDASGTQHLEVAYHDGLITAVTARPLRPSDETISGAADSTARAVLAPGFIDAQVNGFDGLDVNAADVSPETMIGLTRRLASIGVTTWTPTIVTASENDILLRLSAIAEARRLDARTTSAVPDVHLEGPFLSDRDGPRGVHNAAVMRPIDVDEVQRWMATGAPIGIITVSPHSDSAPRRIAEIVSLGIRVAIGHTHATPDQITAAVDAGASLSTHLGNGIAAELPRHPNPIWTQLADDRLTAGLIGDGHHLPLETLEVFLRAKTVRRAFLVSDSTDIAGRPSGRYKSSVGGTVELSASGRLGYVGTGYLAGSGLDLPRAFATVLRGTSANLEDALRLVTSTPASVLPHARPGLGQLVIGAPADFLLLNPDDGAVLTVVQSGHPVGAN